MFVAVVGYVAYKSKGDDYFMTTSDSNLNLGLSYGATLISTSAIIGFGGLAGWIGFSVPLTMVIPFVGLIYFATVYIGPKVWQANQRIGAKTYIELIGKYYKLASTIKTARPNHSRAYSILLCCSVNWCRQVYHNIHRH